MTPRKHIVGDGCKCGAYGAYECGCDGVDWRSSREVELEAEVAEVCSVARSLRDKNDKLHTHNADLEVDIGKWVNLIKQIGFKVKCLYSNFPDDNGHILSKIDEQVAIASAIKELINGASLHPETGVSLVDDVRDLVKELARCKNSVPGSIKSYIAQVEHEKKEAAKLKAENTRLRETLEKIENPKEWPHKPAEDVANWMSELAKAALEGGR